MGKRKYQKNQKTSRLSPVFENEHILNLNTEIKAFLNLRPDKALSDDKQKAAEELWAFNVNREIPPRFGVIAGEIVHHLRSCLDHIAWLLSSEQYRQSDETAIGFPISLKKPLTKDEIRSYQRKVAGISSASALAFIERLQPYHAADPADDPLAIVHELNRIDKHHNLMFVVVSIKMNISFPVIQSVVIGPHERNPEVLKRALTEQAQFKVTFQIAFREFGKRENQPVAPSLTQLCNAVTDVVNMFAGEV
jgi:hypothetical protein